MEQLFKIREVTAEDIDAIVSYWKDAPLSYLKAMGIDTSDLSRFDGMAVGIRAELKAPYSEKKTFHLIAEFDGQAIGHTYVNKVQFGETAFVHLHLWRGTPKGQKLGSRMVAAAIPFFFEKLELQQLLCEPAAANPAPNRTIERLGFELIKTYETVPAGWNFVLEVNQWKLDRRQYQALFT